MTQETYLLAWMCYLVCIAVALFGLKQFMTSWSSGAIKQTLWFMLAAALLVPYSVGDGYSEWAPAILMFSMEALFEGNIGRVGPVLGASVLGALVLSIFVHIWQFKRIKQQVIKDAEHKKESALELDRQALLKESQNQEFERI